MRRAMIAGALLSILVASSVGISSGASNPKVASTIPEQLKTLILNTLASANLRIKDVNVFVQKGRNQTTAESWDYQSPNRAESIPRRFLVSGQDYGSEIDVGDSVVDHFSIVQLVPGTGVTVVNGPKFFGIRLALGRGQWTNVQSQLFAPLIDALTGNRYEHSNGTYAFSSRDGTKGTVRVNSRRVVSAQVTYFVSSCSRKFKYLESESFYGIEHFAKVVAPPSSAIQFAAPGKVTEDKKIVCK